MSRGASRMLALKKRRCYGSDMFEMNAIIHQIPENSVWRSHLRLELRRLKDPQSTIYMAFAVGGLLSPCNSSFFMYIFLHNIGKLATGDSRERSTSAKRKFFKLRQVHNNQLSLGDALQSAGVLRWIAPSSTNEVRHLLHGYRILAWFGIWLS